MNKEDMQELFTSISIVLPFPEAPDVCSVPEYKLGWEMCATNVYERMENIYNRGWVIPPGFRRRRFLWRIINKLPNIIAKLFYD